MSVAMLLNKRIAKVVTKGYLQKGEMGIWVRLWSFTVLFWRTQ